LNFAQVTVLDGNDNVLGTASNTSSGADVTLAGIALPADGTYKIRVKAPTAQASSTGNYVITAWNATVNEFPLLLGHGVSGNIDNPFRIDRWSFSAPAGQLIKFSLIAAESSAIQFDLTGPNGFTAFSNANVSSADIALPTAGQYAVTVHSSNRQTGAYTFRVDQTAVTALTLNTPLDVPLAGGSQSQLFQFNVPQSQQLIVSLTDSNEADRSEIYVRYGSPPTRADFQFKSTAPGSANQSVDIPSAAPGTWFVLVYTDAASQPGSYSLKAEGGNTYLRKVEPKRASTNADAVLTLTGLGFTSASTVTLVGNNLTIPATSIQFDQPTQITATFAAGSVPAGTYAAKISNATVDLVNSITFVQGGQPKLSVSVEAPGALGYHNPSTLYLKYSNKGDAAMPAPLLMLTPQQTHANGVTDAKAFVSLDQSLLTQGFWTSAAPTGFSHSIQVLASGRTPGILQPGESMEIPVYWAGWQEPWDLSYPPFHFDIRAAATTETKPFDWDEFKAILSPPEIDVGAWDVIWSNMELQMGGTWGSYIAALDNTASYLGRLGNRVTDIDTLFSFQLALANGLTISPQLAQKTDAISPAPGLPLTFTRTFSSLIDGRYRAGPLGYGWRWGEGWDGVLTVQADGTVLIRNSDGEETVFKPDRRGGYFPSPGDLGKLIAGPGGTFQVHEADGTISAYRADGRVDFLADANGNRITAGYTGNRLTSLTHSSGQDFQFAYNAAGRITSVTDDVGRITQYAYDAANEHLLTVTEFDGQVTTYAYDTSGPAATRHALLSVTHSDGTHEFFSYDSRGRLSNTNLDGNAERMQFTYGAIGQVAATDALGATTTVFFDHRGIIAKVNDALNRQTFYTFDAAANLISSVDPAGQRSTFAHDKRGNVTRMTDPLGQSVQLTYGIFDEITSFTDAKGHAIRYGYDAKGNLISTTYVDGSIESLAYDPIGNLIKSTDRRGQATQYTYNAAGRLLSKTFADSSQTTYVYDARGNLTAATDAGGTVTLEFDDKDRVKQITYPGNRFLKYTYDAAGRRTQMTDQTSFTVNYSYDAAGRLASLTDGTSASIVSYVYDAGGQLLRKNNGNQTYTTYEYDLAGQLLHLVHFNPDNSISSRFDYTYDLLGQAKTMTTLDGAWSYTYDAIGQLTRAVFLSANPGAVPNQDLAYQYDAAGNRTSTVINGVTTAYVSNNLNQYTSIGAASFIYDANGNLTQKTEGGTTTAYAYNLENRLTGITLPGDGWSFQYDALGNPIAETHAGQTVRNLVDPVDLGDVVARFSGAGALLAHFVHGLGLVSHVGANGTTAFYNVDANANAVALTGAGGAVVNAYRYLPFGAPLTASETIVNPFQFSGAEGVMVAAPGLSFMRARFYDSTAGRFTQMDPINIAGGPNLYAYADNDPVNQTDPSGLKPTFADDAARAAYERLLKLERAKIASKKTIDKVMANLGEGFKNAGQGVGKKVISSTSTQATKTTVAAGRSTRATRVLATAGKLGKLGLLGAGLVKLILKDVALSVGHFVVDRFEWKKNYDDFIYERFPLSGIAEILLDPLILNIASKDPNEKFGPGGFGTAGFVAGDGVFPYRIDFENDKEATAPAQVVRINDQLSDKLDWDTFQLTEIGFGDLVLTVPEGNQHFQTSVSMTQNGTTFDVLIEAGIRLATGEVFAHFQSIDPSTELPPNVLFGFLPPEDETGRGQGHISYTIKPKANLPTGTEIRNIALITFDFNESISTNQVDPHDPSAGTDAAKEALVTIDVGGPTSSVTALPAVQNAAFTLKWTGADDTGGSGVGTYDVFVSDNNSPFTLLQDDIPQTSVTFNGQAGHTYRFYTVATDNVGHAEAPPAAFDAETAITTHPWFNAPAPLDVDNNGQVVPFDALLIINYLNAGSPTVVLPTAATGGGPGFLDTTGNDEVAPLDALIVINALNAGLAGEGEAPSEVAAANNLADLIAMLAGDVAEQLARRRRRS
jgi:RHS repeat-associated protein